VMLQSRLSDGTMPQLSATTAPLLLPLGVAGTTPSSMSEPAQPDKFTSEGITSEGRMNMQATHRRRRSGGRHEQLQRTTGLRNMYGAYSCLDIQ